MRKRALNEASPSTGGLIFGQSKPLCSATSAGARGCVQTRLFERVNYPGPAIISLPDKGGGTGLSKH